MDSPPPAYEFYRTNSTSISGNLQDHLPPSYDAFSASTRREQVVPKKKPFHFITRSYDIVFGSSFGCCTVRSSDGLSVCFFVLIYVSVSVLPVYMIIVGSENLKNCKDEPIIPIWLTVFGSFGLFSIFVSFVLRTYVINEKRTDEEFRENKILNLKIIIDIFLLIWLFCGSYWIGKNVSVKINCNSKFFNTALTMLVMLLVIYGFIILYFFISFLIIYIRHFVCKVTNSVSY